MKPSIRNYAFDSHDVRAAPEALRPAAAGAASERMSQQSKLERNYPQMARAISLLWGYPEMNEYFDKLWLSDGSSQPIDPEVMADLMLLARVHQEVLPVRPKTTLNSIYGTAYAERATKSDVWSYAHRMR